jgi:hypothetical protein
MRIEVTQKFSIKYSRIKFQEVLPSSFLVVSYIQMAGQTDRVNLIDIFHRFKHA